MSRKFSYQGVIVVIVSLCLVVYYFIIFRQSMIKDRQQHQGLTE